MLVVFAVLVLAPYVINWDSRYGNYIFEQLGIASGSRGGIRVIGSVKGSFLLPKITVSNLHVECNEDTAGCVGTVSIDRLELHLSPLSMLLGGPPSARSIEVHGLRTNARGLASIVAMQTKHGTERVYVYDSIIKTGGVIGGSTHNAVHVRHAVVTSSGKTLSGDAVLKVGNAKYSLAARLENKSRRSAIRVELSSPNTSVLLQGKGDGAFDNLEAVLEAKTSNLSELTQTIAAVTDYSVLGSVTSTEALTLSAKIKSAQEGGFSVKDLNIKGQSVSGGLSLVCTSATLCKAALNFASIDLDTLFPGGLGSDPDAYHIDSARAGERFSVVPPRLNATFSLDIKEIHYRGRVSKNLVAAVTVRQGRVAVERLLLDLPGQNNHLRISGVTSGASAGVIPRFIGTLNARGDDAGALVSWLLPLQADARRVRSGGFALTGNLYIAPRIFSVLGVKAVSGATHLNGSVKYKYGRRGGEIIGDVTVGNFGTDGYNLDKEFNVKRDVMSFAWLRSVSCPMKLSVKLHDVKVDSGMIGELSFLADLSQRGISIERIHFRGIDKRDRISDLEGRASVTLSSRGMRPKIFLDLKSKTYSDAFLWLPQFMESGSEQIGDETTGKEKTTKLLWSRRPLDLSSFEGLDGSVDLHADSLHFSGSRVILSDLTWASTLKEGLMSLDKLYFRQGADSKGLVNISGNIGMGEVSSVSLVVSASDVSIGEVDQTGTEQQLSGRFSVSGSLQTQGRNMIELANALKGKAKFAAKGLNVVGVDFNGFIEDLLTAESKSEVASLARVHLYRDSTVFETLNGESVIDRGMLVSSLKFNIENAAGSASVNFFIPQFTVLGLFRFFFIPPEAGAPVHMDMHLNGHVLRPNPTFDIDSLYEIVRNYSG
ncbi:MAG: AsmA-like C-terminal region-containing protein [Anaplasma sp.]